MQQITFVAKPMATLIITRRLYNIVSLRSVEPPSHAAVGDIELLESPTKSAHASPQRLKDRAIEWALGLAIPVIAAGPLCKPDRLFDMIEAELHARLHSSTCSLSSLRGLWLCELNGRFGA